jgi:dTDP-4-amino-4,6-dideoxygalactose transaminase
VQVHYVPVYWHPYYRELGWTKGICPKAEDFYSRAISLPLFPMMSDAEVERVVDAVRQAAVEIL